MKEKKPTSFRIFIVVVTVIALLFLTATLFSHYHVDKKYAMILAFFMFVTLSFTTVGIYTGFNHITDNKKSKNQNRFGLIGNLLIFLLTIVIMAIAALSRVI